MVSPEFFVYVTHKLRRCLRNQVSTPAAANSDENDILEYVLDTAGVTSVLVDKLERELHVYEQ